MKVLITKSEFNFGGQGAGSGGFLFLHQTPFNL